MGNFRPNINTAQTLAIKFALPHMIFIYNIKIQLNPVLSNIQRILDVTDPVTTYAAFRTPEKAYIRITPIIFCDLNWI